MKTTAKKISDKEGSVIHESKALIWGNNAAWLCTDCEELLANRTGDSDFKVTCSCGARYKILRSPSKKSGKLHLGPAKGVQKI